MSLGDPSTIQDVSIAEVVWVAQAAWLPWSPRQPRPPKVTRFALGIVSCPRWCLNEALQRVEFSNIQKEQHTTCTMIEQYLHNITTKPVDEQANLPVEAKGE